MSGVKQRTFVLRSLGSTLDLTAIAAVRCQHAEGCGEPLKYLVTNNK